MEPPGEIVTHGRERLFDAVEQARREVLLVSPFLSRPIANELAARANASHAVTLRLLTSLSERATRAGVLSREGLLTLLDAGFHVRSVADLHAKVWLVDDAWGLIGSGNLTVSGLGGDDGRANAELGVVLSASQRAAARAQIDRWWQQAKPLDAMTVLGFPPPVATSGGRGRAIGPSVASDLAPVLRTARARGESTGRWLKILHDAPGRYEPGYFGRRATINDRQRIGRDGTPTYRPAYEEGDLLIVYVAGVGCPAILRVTRPAGELPEPDRVRADPDALPDDWKRWTWVTEVSCVEEVALADAPTLEEIGVGARSVRQHGRITLSVAQFAQARAAILAAKG